MGPGEDPFSRFGHAAICVRQPEEAGGRCYNYGTADFSTPVPLTFDFIRGRAMFWVSLQGERRMIAAYAAEDRTVWRQDLPLDDAAAVRLAEALEASRAEDVKFYRYHHFRDNCTTRIRDHIDHITDGALSRGADVPDGPSYREAARAGFAGDLPLLLAAELVLGRAADGPTTRWELMFLPAALREEVASRLGAAPIEVNTRKAPPPSGSTALARAALVAAGLGLGAGLLRARQRVAVVLTGLLLGFPALALWTLALASAFDELRANEVLLCLWPTDLLLGALPARWWRPYAQVRMAVLAGVALGSLAGLLVQPLAAVGLAVGLPMMALARVGRAAAR